MTQLTEHNASRASIPLGYIMRDTGPELLVLKRKKSAGLAQMKNSHQLTHAVFFVSAEPDPQIQDKEANLFK